MEPVDVKVKSLYKCLKILECFSAKTPELEISEIAKKLDLNKSNVHNMLSTLSVAGYIEKNPLSDKYMLSNKMIEFSYVITSHLNYQNAVLPVMDILSAELESVVYFGVPHGNSVLYMFLTFPKRYIKNLTYRSIMGEKAPLYCTSLGKAMLSVMKNEEILERISGEKERFTEKTMVNNEEILRDVYISRECGYAIDDIEHESNIRCVGVPILNRKLDLIGAMSVSGSTQQNSFERLPHIAEKLMAATFEIRRSI